MKREFISFLPTSAVDRFLSERKATERLRIAMKALSESHKFEFSDKNFDDDAEPYIALRGYNIPALSDARMLVEYLNNMNQEIFYVDASQEWETICVCYIRNENEIEYDVAEGKLCPRCGSKLYKETILDYPYYCHECDENFYEFEI